MLPLKLFPEMVKHDVINGYVSYGKAREAYGVVVDPKICEVDAQATEKLRAGKHQVSET